MIWAPGMGPIQELYEALLSVTSANHLPKIILTGDFNIPHIIWGTEEDQDNYHIKQTPQYGNEVNEAI